MGKETSNTRAIFVNIIVVLTSVLAFKSSAGLEGWGLQFSCVVGPARRPLVCALRMSARLQVLRGLSIPGASLPAPSDNCVDRVSCLRHLFFTDASASRGQRLLRTGDEPAIGDLFVACLSATSSV